jgi:hypothetical protein
MNQEAVKKLLLDIEKPIKDFDLIFSGKESAKVDGLYKPALCEIIIHNRNFHDENELIYTAIHEYAHHIHFTTSAVPVSARSHVGAFWDILHRLLNEAERKGLYRNIFKTHKDFRELTARIKEKFLTKNGELMKEFGQELSRAFQLCLKHHVSFDDYMDRELNLHRNAAKTLMKISSLDINPEIGFENMKIVASIRDPVRVKEAEKAFLEGKSPDMVKQEFKAPAKSDIGNKAEDDLSILRAEQKRISRTIERLTKRLAEVEKEIAKREKTC